jgi:HSP20 family protein
MRLSPRRFEKMMTLYVSPYRRIARGHAGMNRYMGNKFHSAEVSEREKILAIDVKESDEAYTIAALLPGLEADEINVEILKNTVTISGEFNEAEQEDEKYLMCELPSGRFNRVVSLPTAVDADGAEAHLKNGVFSLLIPKSEASRQKSIKIEAE